jgi:hypothetical protein
MNKIALFITVAALFATSVAAQENIGKNAKVTLVFDQVLPNVPGKSMRVVLVEYGPGGGSPSHRHLCARAGGSDPQQSERGAGAYLSSWRELDRGAG